jgi:ribosomal protein S12 methylthiotransferase accessory factor
VAPPLRFRGQSFTGTKGYKVGTHRQRTPSETFALIEPYLAAAGVTRIADVTGLDNVGVPTTLALRPNSPTMACSSGKGMTIEAARVSGAMEAIELHAAEIVQPPHVRASYREIAASYRVAPVHDLQLTRSSLFNEDWPFRWVLGWDLLTQGEVAVPLAVVEMSRSRARVTDLGAFLVSSNGLASGNSFLEAVAAALYEVTERDAVACYRAACQAGVLQPRALSAASLRTYPLVSLVLDRCDAAGVQVVVYDCTVDTDIATYDAYVYDLVYDGLGLFHGHGTHLDGEVAVLRAVTEALQGRLNYIAGSRDDIFRSAFSRVRGSGTRQVVASLHRDATSGPHAAVRPSQATDTFEDDINELLKRLQRAGMDHVVVVDITPPGFPIHVVRVVVPGFEGYAHYGYTPGRRARRYQEAHR